MGPFDEWRDAFDSWNDEDLKRLFKTLDEVDDPSGDDVWDRIKDLLEVRGIKV